MSQLKSQDLRADTYIMGNIIFKVLLGGSLIFSLNAFAEDGAPAPETAEGIPETAEALPGTNDTPPEELTEGAPEGEGEANPYGLKNAAEDKYGSIVNSCKTEMITDALQPCDTAVQNYRSNAAVQSSKAEVAMIKAKESNSDSIRGSYKIGETAISNNKDVLTTAIGACGFGGLDAKFLGMGGTKKVEVCSCPAMAEFPEEATAEEQAAQDAALTVYNDNKAACQTYITKKRVETQTALTDLQNIADGLKRGKNRIMMIGGGVAAVGVGYAVISSKNKKKKKKKAAKKAQQEMDAGIITMQNGEKKECFTTENYQSLECRDTMFRMCQDSEHSGKTGCQAFNGFYCGIGSGNENTGYCNYQAAVSYCSGPSEVLKQSPACQWAASRPASCASNAGDMNCLSAMSPSVLSEKCQNFPNDPLCKKAATGAIVSQPSGSAVLLTPNDGSSASLSSVVGGNTVQVKQNLWDTNSSTLSNLYGSGQLEGNQ